MNHIRFKKAAEDYTSSMTEGIFQRPQASGYGAWSHLKSKKDNGKLVLFVHGTGNDRFFLMYELFLSLLDCGYSIFTFDLDGHGSQGTTIFNEYGILSCFADWYHFVVNNFSFQTIHVLGNSLGGMIAVHGLAVYELSVTSLTLLAVPEVIDVTGKQMVSEAISPMHKVFREHVRRWGLAASLPALGSFNRKKFPFRLAGPSTALSYVRQVARLSRRLGFRDHIAPLKVPILALYGDRDRIAPPVKLISLLGAQREVRLLASNHFLMPLQPQLAQHLDSWLRKY